MAHGLSAQGIVVVGGQWGDEGKGRIVDSLAEYSDVVVRFQGGNNAGHSLHIGEQSLVLHLIPCGIMRPGRVCMIGNGVVIDPEVLFKEIEMLNAHGVAVSFDNLRIARNAHIIFPFHKQMDALREAATSFHIGTTKRGIGPCYEDKVGRFGITVADLLSPTTLRKKLQIAEDRYRAEFGRFEQPFMQHALFDWATSMGDRLAPFMCDVGESLDAMFKQGKRVLFEGAQGALLDVDHGTYPYVTSSNCVAAQAAIGSGVGATRLKEVLLVTKAYCTRVGEGPFFSETSPIEQERFRKLGNEFGATTGRPRRCGWLDIPALKYAARINGASAIAVTKTDILAGLGTIRVGMSYRAGGKTGLTFLEAMQLFHEGETVTMDYQDFAPVGPMPDRIDAWSDLPKTIQDVCRTVEESLEIPIRLISYGRERGQEFFVAG